MKFILKVATENIQKDAVNMQKMNISAASFNNPLSSHQNNFRRSENNVQLNYNDFIHHNPQFEIVQNPTFSPHKTELLGRPSEQLLTIDTNPNNLNIANGRNNNQYVQNLQRNGPSQPLNQSPNNNNNSPINNNNHSPNNKNHLQNNNNYSPNNNNFSPNNSNYPPNNNNYSPNNNNYSPNNNNYSPNGTQYQSYSQKQYSASPNKNYPAQYQPLQNISPSHQQQLPFGDQATLDPYAKSPSIPRVQRNNSTANAQNYDLHSSPNNTQEVFNGNLDDATYKIRDQMFSDPNHPAYGHQYDSLDWFKNEYENHRRYKHEKPRVSSNYEVYIICIY